MTSCSTVGDCLPYGVIRIVRAGSRIFDDTRAPEIRTMKHRTNEASMKYGDDVDSGEEVEKEKSRRP